MTRKRSSASGRARQIARRRLLASANDGAPARLGRHRRELTRQANVRCGLSASGASVDQVDFLVRQAFRLAGHLVRPVERQHVRQQESDNRRSDCRGGPTRALNLKQVAHFNKVCFDLFIDPSGRGQNRDPPKITTPKRKNPFLVQRQLKGTGRDGKRTRTGTFRASYFTADIRSSSERGTSGRERY
jgi:hypothetical protein